MRGSSFYKENRLAMRDLDKNYLVHRDMLNRIKQRQKSNMLEAQGLKAFEIKSKVGSTNRTSLKGSHNFIRHSYQDNGSSSMAVQQPAFFNMRRRNKTPDMWGPHDLNSRIFSLRKSQDMLNRGSNASHILSEEFVNKAQFDRKRNLKTAGGVGLASL